MATITTRAGKGSPLTNTEVDNNFTNLNTAKYESGNNVSFGTVSSGATTITSGTAVGLTINHDTFAKGLILHRNHASNAASIEWKNNSGRTGILFAHGSEQELKWRPGTTTNDYKLWHTGNDGSGSGLDADTLDGQQETAFVRVSTGNSSDLNSSGHYRAGMFGWYDQTSNRPGDSYGQGISIVSSGSAHNNSSNWITQLAFGTNQNSAYFRGKTNNGSWGSWRTFFHTGNDGSGSGLDADTLDGIQGSSFLRSDANDTATGRVTFNGIVDLNSTVNFDASGQQIAIDTDGYRKIFDFTRNGDIRMVFRHQTNQDAFDFDFTSGSQLTINSNRILTTADEGSGNGLDADTLDGLQASSFLRSDAADTGTTLSLNKVILANSEGDTSGTTTGTIIYDANFFSDTEYSSAGATFASDGGGLAFYGENGWGRVLDSANMQFATLKPANVTISGNNVWHAGNDGSGSGLDADLLDGDHKGAVIQQLARTVITSTSDLNTLSGHGWYGWGSNNPSNSPADYGVLRYLSDGSQDQQWVTAYGGSTNKVELYGRRKTNGNWDTSWTRFWSDKNDGSGSGLDADTIDGTQGANILRSSGGSTVNASDTNGYARITQNSGSAQLGLFRAVNNVGGMYIGGSGDGFRVWNVDSGFSQRLHLTQAGSLSTTLQGTVWGASNDGSGSGLDADTVDGIQASSFLRSDTSDTMTGQLKIDSDNHAGGALRIEANQTDTNSDFHFAQEIVSTLSGSQAATGDREQGGIFMDINSTNTGGDTNNEHRAYGMYIDLDSTGDADLVYGVYSNATATPSTGTTTSVVGGYFWAEDNGGSGEVTNLYGVQSHVMSDNSDSDTNNMYAGYFKALNATDTATIGQAHGVYAEIQADGLYDVYGNSYVFRAEYDNNTGIAQTNTTYLYYGNYAGTRPTSAYGVYINDDVTNYFAGKVGIGSGKNNPSEMVDVNGTVKATAFVGDGSGLTGISGGSGGGGDDGPAFTATSHATGTGPPISLSANTWTKVNFNNEIADTDNCYSSSRFTPDVAGWYFMSASVQLTGSNTTQSYVIVDIRKNGSQYAGAQTSPWTEGRTTANTTTALIYFNGSSDYAEVYIRAGQSNSISITFNNRFSGALVRKQ